MKFGRNLPRNQVPEWASQYINYKSLKKLIKNAQLSGEQDDQKPDLAGFFHALDRNLEDVDYFYSKKYQDLARRLKLLEDRYGSTKESTEQVEKEERDDLLQALLELRGQFRKLQWYGEVNRKGFVKITKKLDKKVHGSHAQKKYLALKVDPCSFATNDELFRAMERINLWISRLSEAAQADQQNHQTAIPHKLHRSSSRQALRIPDASWLLLEKHIRDDDAKAAAKLLIETRKQLPDVTERQFQQFLKELLQRAIVSRSRACVTLLLEQIVYLDDSEDINKRNCIHRLVLSIGRAHATADASSNDARTDAEKSLYSFITPAASPSQTIKHALPKDDQHSSTLTRRDSSIDFFQFLLRSLNTDQRNALASRDSAGRTPLHFAAEYGIVVLVQVIIEHLTRWGMFNTKNGFEDTFWQDNDGWTPLHLSVIQGHPVTTQALLEAERTNDVSDDQMQIRRRSPKTAAVLAMATKANFIEVVRILVKAGVDLNCQDSQGETALHVAARFGHVECAQILLEGSGFQKVNTEIKEYLYGWTPLFIASVDGRLSIVELLIESGAKLDSFDDSGWSAHEHAALRGHIELAMRLSEVTPSPIPTAPSPLSTSSSPPKAHPGLIERRSNGVGDGSRDTPKTVDTIKQFGHRYLKDKSMIMVSLGAMDMRKTDQAVSLDHIPMTSASSTQLDTALSVVVSAKGADGEPEIIDLPVHDNISTDPVVFHAVDPAKVQLRFDLVPTYAGSHEKIVGRGVALLSSIKANLGSKRMPLQGDISVPIMTGDFEVIGSITFNFLVITPFSHPKMSVSQDQTYWRKVASTMLIGHRGLGKNFAAGRRSLQLGENTVQSFIAAANLGASYVEFDVQLTKDHVPVIYHDFLVSETGIDAPVHTLTLEQFLHVNESMTPKQSRTASPMRHPNSTIAMIKSGERMSRGRSMSVGGTHDISEMEERMKHTRDFKKKGFKGNSRGNHIQAPFATLEELFKKLPNHIGFNIEMKYPMLSESQDEDMDWYAVELNSFVDTVLTKVYDLGQGRNVIFSSFNPDICLLLSFKQPNIPVMFLTDAGVSPVGDIRASSLQEAIRFAARWNLLGIVSASQPFVIAPRLVRVVKESGLVCVSYGVQNNEDEHVDAQVQQGIDAVIVDNVLKIRKGLSEATSRAERRLDPNLAVGPAELDRSPRSENRTPAVEKATSTTSSVATLSLSGDESSEQSYTEVSGAIRKEVRGAEELRSKTLSA